MSTKAVINLRDSVIKEDYFLSIKPSVYIILGSDDKVPFYKRYISEVVSHKCCTK